MSNYRRTRTLVTGSLLVVACRNDDVPEHEPTLATVTSDDDGGAEGDGGDDDADETADDGEPPQCWPEHSPADPSLYQCVGFGMGDLQWEEYVVSWKDASLADPVTIEFPPPQHDDPNVQACCEADANTPGVAVGCIEDCARAACNLALERLQAKLAAPPNLCVGTCLDRFEDTLTTWISFLEANYDECLRVARGEAASLQLPDPASASDPIPTGAGRQGELTLACTIDATQPPYDTEQVCETSPNGAMMAAWEAWSCPWLSGEVEIDGPLGSEWAPLTGRVTFRRGTCASDPCWLAIDGLELEATIPTDHAAEHVTASLAYQGFGRHDAATGDGTIARGMLGLDVVMGASSSTPLAFTIANSDATLLELGAGTFAIVDAWFAWDDGSSATIRADATGCSCTSCT